MAVLDGPHPQVLEEVDVLRHRLSGKALWAAIIADGRKVDVSEAASLFGCYVLQSSRLDLIIEKGAEVLHGCVKFITVVRFNGA